MKMMIAPLMLALVFLVFLMTTSVAVTDNESDTTLTFGIKGLFNWLSQNQSTEWLLSPTHEGLETKMGYLVIQADNEWQLQAEDENPLTAGHMREWNGTSYGERCFSNPIRISAKREVILPDGGAIQTGNKTDYLEIPITFKQELSWLDEPLFGKEDEIYRIVITFSVNSQV